MVILQFGLAGQLAAQRVDLELNKDIAIAPTPLECLVEVTALELYVKWWNAQTRLPAQVRAIF